MRGKSVGGGFALSAEGPPRDDSVILSEQAPRTPLCEDGQLPNDTELQNSMDVCVSQYHHPNAGHYAQRFLGAQ